MSFDKPIAAGTIASGAVLVTKANGRQYASNSQAYTAGAAITIGTHDTGASVGTPPLTTYTSAPGPLTGTNGLTVASFANWPTVVDV